MVIVLFFVIAYLIGSISPGYIFGRFVKGIDIRMFGNGNTGATNTYRIVSPSYGILAGIFDFLKAPLVYYMSISGLALGGNFHINPDSAIVFGLAGVLGHIFPIYLGFRGGRGVASLFGLVAITLFFTQSWYALLFVASSTIYTLAVSRSIKIEFSFRKLMKLSALLLPLAYFWLSESIMLRIIGILLFVSLILDFSRFLFPGFNRRYLNISSIAKKKELKRLSGYSLFLISVFIIFWLFPGWVAIASVTIFIFADLLAPIGQFFLTIRLIKEKTVGGALIIFGIAFIAGIFLKTLAGLPLSMELVWRGSLAASVLDQFSFLLDDNLLVPIGIAVVLFL
ncbi:MAG: glycerol-3-phosphate acyltransferase [Candidatus Yanofskybacteria bacterium]|nr:glycerol-3-phosphate acyltransferase [Candidatus Yanofskybacteria bacterium]